MKSLKLLLRCLTVAALVLLLLIPLSLIRGTIEDRQGFRDEAVARVSRSKAGKQQFLAPVRVVPWTQVNDVDATDAAGRTRKERHTVTGFTVQTPRQLHIEGALKPGERRVGLFRVQVYSWVAQVETAFDALALEPVAGRTYGEPYLAVGLSDVRGLVGTPVLKVDGQPRPLLAGSRHLDGATPGLHARLAAPVASAPLPALQRVTLDLALDGTQSLSVVPIADDNRVSLHSPWPHPSFGGSFLPNERRIDAGGFRAQWAVSALATGAQQQLLQATRGDAEIDALQVSLVDPVDVYTQADRASKYGILFVLLTFVGFALFELIKRLPIHPLQYLLVGLALAIFFLLLLSLSEHIAFWKAYLVSAVACIGLQFVYLSGVLRSWARAGGFAAMLTALYGVLYSLLASEDNALLMGSLLLFGILAAIMWVTRKVDWYGLAGELR